ncbi:MAG: type I-C CRISPR-associated protein Cas7/Csd2 [Candidatus Wallbacteria bacterium]|nr:type I-C CRISPR-associated protein Cas7/Csd2 [Candidatus Wallbacteria bacterium]
MTQPIQNRYEFVLLFDVRDGNPNGDPDAGNMPRIDPETGRGLITDVCLKRKVRNFVGLRKEDRPPYEIYVKERAVLNEVHERAYKEIGASEELDSTKKRKGGDKVDEARKFMCRNFFDVRTFGAVMSTGVNCGQVRGPVQLTFARSIDMVVPLEHSITRMAVTTKAESENQGGDNRTMGRKYTIPYGLYRSHGFVSAALAAQTGFGEEDLALLWEACTQMFDHDRSAARGEMSTRRLIVFRHESRLGNSPAHKLFDRVTVQRVSGVEVPRGFEDYQVRVEDSGLPKGIEILSPGA